MKKAKKRLLIVIWHLGIGGMQKRMRDVSKALDRENKDWEIYFLVKHYKKSFIAEDLEKNTRVKIIYFTKSHFWSNSIFSVIWLLKKYVEINPDVCLTFLDHLSVIMVLIKKIVFWRRTKLVLNESMLTSKYIEISREGTSWFWKRVIKKFYPYSDLIITPTRAGKKDLIDCFGVDSKKIVVIPNWTLFTPKPVLKPKYDLIFIGRVEHNKGIRELISLMGILQNRDVVESLAVVGDGKNMGWFRDEIVRNNIQKVVILGYRYDIQRLLLKSKILILPTLNEGFPNVILEAGMCGVPVITNNFDGVGEVIKNGWNGYIVDDVKEMAEKINNLLINKKKYSFLRRNLKSVISKEFSMNNQKQFIASLINSSPTFS